MDLIDKRYVIKFIRDSSRIHHECELFLRYGDNVNDDVQVDVVVSKDNRSFEKQIIGRITDKDYMFNTRCLGYIESYFSSIPLYERDILIDRYKKGMTVEQVWIRNHSSRTTVYGLLNKHMEIMIDGFKKIYHEVYYEMEGK